MTLAINKNKDLYRRLLKIAVPMMIQNGVSQIVNLLDNFMIGQVSTNALSGVGIANQMMFVFYLMTFGATAGSGIFTAQYYGKKDWEGVRITFRFKLITNLILSVLACFIFYFGATFLVSRYLQGEGDPADAAETLKIGVQYLHVMIISLIPIGICQAYAGTLRDIGQTKVPLVASACAILVNFTGNLLLIYGLLGFPALGALGAAIATVISRFVELGVLVVYVATHKEQCPFIVGAFKHFRIPGKMAREFIIRATPLLLNETMWSFGITMLNQSYSYRTLDAMAAIQIETSIYNVMMVAFVAMGEAVGILTGQILGSGKVEEAKKNAFRMIWFTVAFGTLFGIIMICVSPFFPMIFPDATVEIKNLATWLIVINGTLMPFYSFTHASYFIIRSGGKTLITMIFDSGFVWILSVPFAFVLSHYTSLPLIWMVAAVQALELIKCITGGLFVKSGIWAKDIT
ncbi:MAG: MATE family efflux transporter [Clostridiales bacterium]|nr:MATE family efflux transporter [Clostridiales bacterium]